MDRSLLVKLFGFSVMLIHGDTLVIDRWNWLKNRLPKTNTNVKLLDVGCGTGAFTIGLALDGYESLGVSWDKDNIMEAAKRAKICRAERAKFETQDIRLLDQRQDFIGNFDVVICLEAIEHILDDQKLMKDMFCCLKPGGRLFLTTPNYDYVPLYWGDKKQLRQISIEDGGHVRPGYTRDALAALCRESRLQIEEISYCSWFFSQKITGIMRVLDRINPLFSWVYILPLRVFPLFFDDLFAKIFNWPGYSICLVARKIK